MHLRDSTDADLPIVQAIYAHHVQHGTGSFEYDAPDLAEMARRRADVLGKQLPFIVATESDPEGDTVLGFAYANWLRPRPGYRYAVENSIYVHPEHQRKGVARLLMIELIARCERAGARQMIAVIGDSENHGSIGLHTRLGFTHAGTLKSTGWKFGRWLDTVFMQRPLGLGDRTPAADA